MTERKYFIETEAGRQIYSLAVMALDTHFCAAKRILLLLDPTAPPLTAPIPVTTTTRRAYSAMPATPLDIERLTPAQRTIWLALKNEAKPLDVVDLSKACRLKRKTVTNALSLLRQRQLVSGHDKR